MILAVIRRLRGQHDAVSEKAMCRSFNGHLLAPQPASDSDHCKLLEPQPEDVGSVLGKDI